MQPIFLRVRALGGEYACMKFYPSESRRGQVNDITYIPLLRGFLMQQDFRFIVKGINALL